MSAVLHRSRAKGTDKVVLLGLANHADEQGHAWPSLTILAGYANVSRSAVRDALRRLEALGEVRTAGQRPEGPTTYQVMVR